MLKNIELAVKKINDAEKPLRIISHFDTDGITSAAIFSRALQRSGKKFSLKIVKNLEEDFIKALPEDHILIFLDLGSGSLNYLKNKKTDVFIFDHHEIVDEIPENVLMINPFLDKGESLSASAVCYLFAKALSRQNMDLATLAVVGMVGDLQEKNIGRIFSEILEESETTVKKGLLLYPSTRPLDKALEYCSNPYIPGVTGSYSGVIGLLKDAGLAKVGHSYKALYELTEEEMTNLITAVMVRCAGKAEESIGNLFLVKFFNKLEDARELSALINACSRMDFSNVSLGFCLGNKEFKQDAEKIYIGYKQSLVSALKYVADIEKIKGEEYVIIHGKDKIKDTIIGTVASIISHSPSCSRGSVVIALAYNEDKIKVSARLAGSDGCNVREVLSQVVVPLGGEVGGHSAAAGCLISREQESEFIAGLKKILK